MLKGFYKLKLKTVTIVIKFYVFVTDTGITARCWGKYVDGECSEPIGDKAMTAEMCCNTLGVAWGNGECTHCDDIGMF